MTMRTISDDTTTTRTRYAVTWIEADGSEVAYGERVMLQAAQELFDQAKQSPKRAGRGVGLSCVQYIREDPRSEWTIDTSEFVDAEGGE